jgi:hypothetical protein
VLVILAVVIMVAVCVLSVPPDNRIKVAAEVVEAMKPGHPKR